MVSDISIPQAGQILTNLGHFLGLKKTKSKTRLFKTFFLNDPARACNFKGGPDYLQRVEKQNACNLSWMYLLEVCK